SFLQDVQYRSLMVNSASYNVRLMRERKTRLPFLDSQTGIAQNPCKLYMNARHRMPSTVEGQLYVYPAQRWCRRKRSYLALSNQTQREVEAAEHTIVTVENPAATIPEETTAAPFDSKVVETYQFYDPESFLEEDEENEDDDDDDTYTGRQTKKRKKPGPKPSKAPKAPGVGRGRKKKKEQLQQDAVVKAAFEGDEENSGKPYECQLCGARYKTRQGLSYHLSHTHKGGGSGRGGSGGRGKGGAGRSEQAPSDTNNAAHTNQDEALQPGSHQQGDAGVSQGSYQPPAPCLNPQSDALSGLAELHDQYLGYMAPCPPTPVQDPNITSGPPLGPPHNAGGARASTAPPPMDGYPLSPTGRSSGRRSTKKTNDNNMNMNIGSPSGLREAPQPEVLAGEMLTSVMAAGGGGGGRMLVGNAQQQQPHDVNTGYVKSPNPPNPHEKARVQPSPYCDFCLGDASMNKKSMEPEELVSCSDCGRSGHPTCLQFTPHMMVSVRQYRWQCIECKACSLCGTSENDDQLLFCDDCDRGYHLYCLRPPLHEPPEGEWSCLLCQQQFHW
ncbi:unnamed protein product, partial [Meganyctiphanes norvegica]